MRSLAILALLALAGCRTTEAPPPAPEVILAPVTTYVPVPEKMTEPCPIAHGDLSEVVIVARKRKAALEKCNTQLDAIRGLQGTEVQP